MVLQSYVTSGSLSPKYSFRELEEVSNDKPLLITGSKANQVLKNRQDEGKHSVSIDLAKLGAGLDSLKLK